MMQTTEMTTTNGTGPVMPMAPADFADRAAAAIDDVIGKGDLSKMTATERVNYYRRVCESLGINPLTKPFEYVNLGGLKLYATKGCTDQLRGIKKISLPKDRMTKEYDPQTGLYTVEAPEDPLKAERKLRVAPLIAQLESLPKAKLDFYRADWEKRFGTSNPKMLDFEVMDAELARIQADLKEDAEASGGDEADPFEDPQPLLPVNGQSAPAAEKGHGAS